VTAGLITNGTPHGIGELIGVIAAGAVGLAVGAVTLARRGTPPFVALLMTLGLSFVGVAVVIALFGDHPAPSVPLVPGIADFLGVQVEWQRLLIIGVAFVAFVVIALFFERTDLGRAMTAAASNPRAARLVGVSIRRMGLASFTIGGLLGGIAGVLLAPMQQLSAYSDLGLAFSGFAAAVFGGLASPWLTLLGGLVLGVAGAMLQGYEIGSFQNQLSLVLMVIVMIVRARALNRQEEAK